MSAVNAYSLPLFDSPQHMLGSDVPDFVQLPELPGSPPSNPRQEVIEATCEKADPAFKLAYAAHLLEFAEGVADFTACDVTLSYESLYGKLTIVQGKQLGWIYQRLMKDGTIEKCGARQRNQGNLAHVYRLKK